jgi:hypothetical protein
LIVKSVFKSHFKVKKNFLKKQKNIEKKIFVKNMFIFLLFSKIFLKGCLVSFFFKKNKVNSTNILKAPSRHKKFFHQVFYEYFQISFFFKFFLKRYFKINTSMYLFKKINNIFNKIGSNTLTRIKISTTIPIRIGYNL